MRSSIYLFAAGRRSGDQFCAYVCDRLVVPDLTTEKLDALRDGELSSSGPEPVCTPAHGGPRCRKELSKRRANRSRVAGRVRQVHDDNHHGTPLTYA